MTLSGKPRRIPQAVRDKLIPFVLETTASSLAPKFGHH
jgi:hypothetical protein